MNKVTIIKSWSGNYLIECNGIDYELFEELGTSNLSQKEWDYGVEIGLKSADKKNEYPNDVRVFSYCYKTKEAVWLASSLDDVSNWLLKHKNFVTG